VHEVEHQITATIAVDPKSHLAKGPNPIDRAATKDLGFRLESVR
jgi:hypothetical protein